jgi:hypothetical protein
VNEMVRLIGRRFEHTVRRIVAGNVKSGEWHDEGLDPDSLCMTPLKGTSRALLAAARAAD